MDLEVIYDESIDSLIIKSTSNVGPEEIYRLRDQILEHPNFKTNINQLFDSTKGQIDLSATDLQRIASHYQEVGEKLGFDRKLALVVTRDLDFGKMRQYEAYFDSGPDVLVHAFRSLSEAREWLKQ